MIRFDLERYTNIKDFDIPYDDYNNYLNRIINTNSFYDIDNLFDEELIYKMQSLSNEIKKNNGVLLIVGIGGSYLGSKALIGSLTNYFDNSNIYYAGNSLSSDYLHDLLKELEGKNVYLNVISKSGSTLEITKTFEALKQKVREENIIVTTDKDSPLYNLAIEKRYNLLEIPKTIGGRFSIFTPAGLFPIIFAGINVNELKRGAKDAILNKNYIIKYAHVRNELFKQGKKVEAYVCYEPKLEAFLKWLQQLYGETLGKNKKGILPMTILNTTDLHSLGQFIQEGNPILFQTVFKVLQSKNDIKTKNKSFNELNTIATDATLRAHLKGNVYSNLIEIDKLDEYNIGYLTEFFLLSCYYSSFIEGVNPFTQPGVEGYKREMKEML